MIIYSKFIDWLKGDMGVPGEYQFTKMYWITLAIVVISLIITILLGLSKKISDKGKRRILVAIALFHLIFEVSWRLIFYFVKGTSLNYLWPMYPCNLGGVILPIIVLIDNKTMKKIFYLFGFVGAILTFAVPEGIFSTSVMVFPILKSVLQHTGLLLIPAFEFASGTFRPSLKTYHYHLLGCIIHLINAEGIDRLLGLDGDYMFFRSGMPFVIPGIPQWITFSVFGIVVFALIAFLSNPKESIEVFKKKKVDKK